MFKRDLLFLLLVIIFITTIFPVYTIHAISDIPTILPRSEWTKNDPSLERLLTWIPDKNRNNPPDYYPVERIIVHYTETSNNDNTKELSVARIQSIYQYHAVTRGWGDIGYNYIIDQLGNIYEGRYGGNSVRAAHAFNSITRDNYNVGTIGISLLGNYEKEDPPEAMFISLKKLVGWLSTVNGFDPHTSASSKIWNDTQQGFTTAVNLPRIISHKDIDATNDSGVPASKFNELRVDAQKFYQEYKNFVYQIPGQNILYEITNGEKKVISDGSGKIVVNILQSELDLFATLSVVRHSDHTLIKTANSGISYIEGDYRRPIVNPEIFTSRFSWSNVVTVDKNEWNSYPEGLPITLREGMLVRAYGENDVYVISNGAKRWISGPALFENLGYTWGNVAMVSKQTLDMHPLGDPIIDTATHPDGTLVTAPGKGVAFLSAGMRRPIPTPEIFQLQYQWKDLVSVSITQWDSYTEGNAIYYPEGMLFREKGDNKVYVVENEQKRWITSPVLFDTLGYKWDNVVLVSSGASGGMAAGQNISLYAANY